MVRKRFKKQSYKTLLKIAVDTSVPFNDLEFKSDESSIGSSPEFRSSLNVGKILWRRPKDLTVQPHFLFRQKLGPSASIEFAGQGPNPWFIAAAISLTQDKNLIYRVIPKDQYTFVNGIFKFNLWHFGTWMRIVVDDKLPSFDNKLVFTRSKSGEIFWLPLLEKAYAKLYGSYQKMAQLGSLTNALIDLTGSPVEDNEIHPSDDEKDYFRLIAEELDKKSIICVKTKGDEASLHGLKPNRIYLITNIKKPSVGSFKKTIKETNASIKLVNTLDDPENKVNLKNNFTIEKLSDLWMSIENFTKIFNHLYICHLKINETKKVSIKKGVESNQFCFDINQFDDEIFIELIQETMTEDYKLIGFKIYKIELNRKFRVHNFDNLRPIFNSDEVKQRSIFSRIKLNYGRYLVIPTTSNQNVNLILRLYTQSNSNLRFLVHDLPRKSLLNILTPKYPKYVTKIVVKSAHGLDKQDRFGSANPYCVIRCGRKAIKSAPLHDTLNPDWEDFGAIFYHGKFASIIIEVWNSSIIMNSFLGQIEILPKLVSNEICEIELKGRKKGQSRKGTIKFEISTSEDLLSY